MTKTDERLALVERQRRFEWQLARDAQTRAASKFVSGKTHDLLNLIQIVQLATLELSRRCAGAEEFIADLTHAADDAQRQLTELMAVARPDEPIVRGANVGAAITQAVEIVRAASTIDVDLHLAVPADIATQCTQAELEHLIFGLCLDVGAIDPSDAGPGERAQSVIGPREPERTGCVIDLFVRERTINDKRWVEIVRGVSAPLESEHFDLRAVEAIAKKSGGELATSERRGGGAELVVALPVI